VHVGEALLETCEGQYTEPEDCRRCYQPPDRRAYESRAIRRTEVRHPKTKDGLHHLMPKPIAISALQAVLSLSLASAGTTNFNLSWLDDLPSAGGPQSSVLNKLHNATARLRSLMSSRMANTRPLIPEVLERQGRYKEAIRCENSPVLSLIYLVKTQCLRFDTLSNTDLATCSSEKRARARHKRSSVGRGWQRMRARA
jgi:hypothetical protein